MTDEMRMIIALCQLLDVDIGESYTKEDGMILMLIKKSDDGGIDSIDVLVDQDCDLKGSFPLIKQKFDN